MFPEKRLGVANQGFDVPHPQSTESHLKLPAPLSPTVPPPPRPRHRPPTPNSFLFPLAVLPGAVPAAQVSAPAGLM